MVCIRVLCGWEILLPTSTPLHIFLLRTFPLHTTMLETMLILGGVNNIKANFDSCANFSLLTKTWNPLKWEKPLTNHNNTHMTHMTQRFNVETLPGEKAPKLVYVIDLPIRAPTLLHKFIFEPPLKGTTNSLWLFSSTHWQEAPTTLFCRPLTSLLEAPYEAPKAWFCCKNQLAARICACTNFYEAPTPKPS